MSLRHSPRLRAPASSSASATTRRKWIGAEAVEPARELGSSASRITLQWTPGQTSLAEADIVELQRAVSAAKGIKVVLSVYGNAGSSAPHTDAAREEYCGYVEDALAHFRSVRDVVIWNEPNKSLFWRPQLAEDGAAAAPVAYEALLARCYDLLHSAFADVNVIDLALSPHSPGAFIRALGAAYRATTGNDDAGSQLPALREEGRARAWCPAGVL